MIREFILSVFVIVFALGWIDIGFGPEYTWWNIIYQLGNI